METQEDGFDAVFVLVYNHLIRWSILNNFQISHTYNSQISTTEYYDFFGLLVLPTVAVFDTKIGDLLWSFENYKKYVRPNIKLDGSVGHPYLEMSYFTSGKRIDYISEEIINNVAYNVVNQIFNPSWGIASPDKDSEIHNKFPLKTF